MNCKDTLFSLYQNQDMSKIGEVYIFLMKITLYYPYTRVYMKYGMYKIDVCCCTC